ncbi:MAG: NAD+ synthase [Phycisphaerales bacterium]
MRIALAQINTTVGDIEGNRRLILGAVREARDAGASVVLLPELAVLGYPARDLLLKAHVVERCEEAVARLAEECGDDLLAIVGSPRRNGSPLGHGLCNSAAALRGGGVIAWYDKRLLPTYDVFDEDRYFDPGAAPCVVEHDGRRLGLTICEDLWNVDSLTIRHKYPADIIGDLVEVGADTILNISASPFVVGKPAFRRGLFGGAAQRAGAPLAMANLVGGNDDLIFDGHSLAFDAAGRLIEQGPGFREGLTIVDLDGSPRDEPAPDHDLEDLFEALVLGLRDYTHKCGFREVIIGLSGGIDSAVVATLARAAFGAEQVRGFGMPSRYSSEGSIDDARDLAERLGLRFDLVPIEPAHQAMLDMLEPVFAATGRPPGVAEENIQARLRGNVLMSISNKLGSLLLTTGNKSEIAVGYCTLYGDMSGGLAVISDVPKMTVYALARWMNDHPDRVGVAQAPIPASTISKPPSAELRPDQTDQDSLPPYEILDEIILRYVERLDDAERIARETGFDATLVESICRMIDRNEYKRRQMPTGLKVTGRAFGSGWRMPIAAKGV